ncbi:MAG: DNA topoisomerase IB [Actinomycetota bacterium]|nr:DNA topoisomerase IB [Actinomycetota bacterium]
MRTTTRLSRVDCSRPGLTRRNKGKGWVYVDATGQEVTDPATLERVSGLVLPPAWQDVWICENPRGHIQATGVDARGRRQYRYHDAWRVQRDLEKFDRVLDFAERLPDLRETVCAHLHHKDIDRERALAAAVRLLERGFFRVGSEEYAEVNQTYGLTTLRREHVTVSRSGQICFDYRAKSGKRRQQIIVDPEVLPTVTTLKRRRDKNPELLAYRSGGSWVDLKSDDVNDYLREVTDLPVSAKDFRTWNATVLAAVGLAVAADVTVTPIARKKAITHVVREVSDKLGNTPTVCRASYIDPRVIDLYQGGVTVSDALLDLGESEELGTPAYQGRVERAVLDLLRDPPDVEPLPGLAEPEPQRKAG